MKIAIVDDDENFLETAKAIITDSFEKSNMADEGIELSVYNNGEKFLNNFTLDGTEIVFMDIECGNLNGFDIAREMYSKNKDIGIVYMTNYSHYISSAFVCRPLGFINKMNFQDELVLPIMNIKEFWQEHRREITFRENKYVYKLKVDNIKLVEIYDHKMSIVTINNTIEIRSKLSQYEEELLQNNFVKISRSVLVNLKYIEKIEGQDIWVEGMKKYTGSRERTKDIWYRWMLYRTDV